ncbi:hypothetical protein BB559_004650 [Furculomyces boomerangus]|uniref:Uncharacterized protein n=1 Tax=Furculomyces boomerangus TaxID=61424 RepID=A0A2T9YDH4_9FUNG|nr:hypothetical protein BB559_004650 [Furculomyces boomerangus]
MKSAIVILSFVLSSAVASNKIFLHNNKKCQETPEELDYKENVCKKHSFDRESVFFKGPGKIEIYTGDNCNGLQLKEKHPNDFTPKCILISKDHKYNSFIVKNSKHHKKPYSRFGIHEEKILKKDH